MRSPKPKKRFLEILPGDDLIRLLAYFLMFPKSKLMKIG